MTRHHANWAGRESKDLETDKSSAVARLIRSAADEYYHASRNVASNVL